MGKARKARRDPGGQTRPESPEPARGEPDLVQMSTVERKEVDWLWYPWLPVGELALLEGDPGLAKSTLTLDWIARITRGWPMPPDPRRLPVRAAASVIIMSAEDDPKAVIRPRLDAAGADCGRVWFFPRVKTGPTTWRLPTLPDDLELLPGKLTAGDPSLIVADPMMAFVGGEYDAHKDADIRHCLHRAVDTVRQMRACLLMVRHLNKMSLSPALYRGGGSIGIVGAARVAVTVGHDPDDFERRVIAQPKNNLAPVPPALGYRVESDKTHGCGRIVWDGVNDLEPDEILGHAQAGSRGKPGDRMAAAKNLITTTLSQSPTSSSTLEQLAKAERVSRRTLMAARQQLGVIAEKIGDEWFVRLPAEA